MADPMLAHAPVSSSITEVRLEGEYVPEATDWVELSSLDAHIIPPDTASAASWSRGAGASAQKSRLLDTLKYLGPPRAVHSVSIVWRIIKVSFKRRLVAGARGIKRRLHAIATPIPDDAAKYRRSVSHRLHHLIGETYQCVACMVDIDVSTGQTIQVSCGHLYHAECLLQLVQISMQQPSPFPPRCCRKPISVSSFEHLLSPEQLETFALRQEEQTTARRVYCANPRCSRFLGERNKHIPVHIYLCPVPTCSTRTCARCKAAVSPSTTADAHICTHDRGHRAALQLGARLGWTRCPDCEQLIERAGGCAHMACVCGAHFCYCCGAKWQTCACVEWRGPAGDLELPPGPGTARRAGGEGHERDLFAPLQEDGDLRGRLTLWAPPTLRAGERSEGWPFRPGPIRRRERIPREWTPSTDFATRDHQHDLGGVQYAPQPSRGSSILTVEEDPAQGHVGSCLPLGRDSLMLARGEVARAVRQRGTAVERASSL